jgi:glycosyltransferase involved in cell wall biosynthesis
VPEPVRVLYVVTRMNVGGPARHLLTLLPLMRDRGFEPLLVYGSAGPREGELLPNDDEHAIRFPTLRRRIDPVADLRAIRQLTRLMREHPPQVVHTHMAKAGALGRTAARRAGIAATVHTFHGHVLEGYFGRPVNAAIVRAERHLAGRTDALVAVSSAVRDDLLRIGIGAAEQWRVIGYGLDLEPLLEIEVDPVDARRSLGIPVDVPVVGIVGRLVLIKNHRLFFEAARAVLERHPETVFVVAGDGELRAMLEGEAGRALGDRVRFTGWVLSLPRLYAALDVVVLTSLNEGTPFSLIEAAASGTPVVATDVGGVTEAVVHGETGLVTPRDDASALAREISRIVDDRALARRMGEAGRRHAETAFSPGTMADKIAGLYQEILAAKGLLSG